MVETGIIRDATVDEKRNFIEISKKLTYEQIFQRELNKKEDFYTKQHKPYDRKGAYHDFQDRKEALLKSKERQYGSGATNYIQYEDLKLDLDAYAKAERFRLIDEAEVREEKLLDGIRNSVITGKWQNFQCINHGGRISVFVPVNSLATIEASEKKKTSN